MTYFFGRLTRKPLATLCSAVLLLLTACSPKSTGSVPSASLSPSESAHHPVLDHLEFYDQFDWYNNSVDEHDFVISETEIDGSLQYCFENTEYGVTIHVPPEKPLVATLSRGEETLTFEMPIFILGYGNVSGVADFYLEDLTQDGTPELIYIYGAGGTGAWHDDVKIFDRASMKECAVSWEPEMLTGDMAVFVGDYDSIALVDGQLVLTVLYSEEGSGLGDYAGSFSAPFVFDSDSFAFSPELPCTVTVFDDNT